MTKPEKKIITRTLAAARDVRKANLSSYAWKGRAARVIVVILGTLHALDAESWGALLGSLTPTIVIGLAIAAIGAGFTSGR